MPAWVYLLGFGLMGVAELVALLNKQPGDTISERVWALLHVRRKGPTPWWAWIFRVVIGVTLIWLFGHFELGIWTT